MRRIVTELDEIAVERYMSGTLRKSTFHTSPELIEAVRRLKANGFSDKAIGDRVGISADAVLKTRSRFLIPAAESAAK